MKELAIIAGVCLASFWTISVVLFFGMLVHDMLRSEDYDSEWYLTNNRWRYRVYTDGNSNMYGMARSSKVNMRK